MINYLEKKKKLTERENLKLKFLYEKNDKLTEHFEEYRKNGKNLKLSRHLQKNKIRTFAFTQGTPVREIQRLQNEREE